MSEMLSFIILIVSPLLLFLIAVRGTDIKKELIKTNQLLLQIHQQLEEK